MKKILLIGAATLMVSNPTFAGGILTNTNQHASFLRMIARGASIDIDGVYSNPAGLSFLPEDGFYLSLTGQSAYQTREITSTFPLFQAVDGEGTSRLYKGTASAPFIPSFHGAYKKGDWTISASFAITGGGGCQDYFNAIVANKDQIAACSALYSPLMVREAVDMAVSVLKGEKVDPVLVIPTTIVDRSNVDEYIDPNNTVY